MRADTTLKGVACGIILSAPPLFTWCTAMASSTSTAESIAKELSEQYGNLVPYSPPDWASRLNQVPTHRYVVSAYLASMALVIEDFDLLSVRKGIAKFT